MKFQPGELKNEPLMVAARYNDAISEETSLQGAVENAGLDFDKLHYVAEQRAIRVLLMEQGLDPTLLSRSVPTPMMFTGEERKRLVLYTAAYMDGLMIGWVGRGLQDKP